MSKTQLAIFVVVLALFGGGAYYKLGNKTEMPVDPNSFERGGDTWTRYTNDTLGYSFEYRSEPDGYMVVEQDEEQVPHQEILEFISIFNEREYMELIASSVAREGPPNISILVYGNPSNLTPRQWIDQNSMVSSISLARSDVLTTTLDGAPAVRYMADGLYPNDIIVASHNGRIYFIAGSYIETDTPIRDDFLEMLNYFSLY